MPAKCNDNGRAYEFAWMNVLGGVLRGCNVPVEVKANSSFTTNLHAWMLTPEELRDLLVTSAEAAGNYILELEPTMLERSGKLTLEFQADSNGVRGDVRDIVIKREDLRWEIGLSIKHNHEAIKHSRLSGTHDFGQEWFDIPCSQEYWTAIKPIFARLDEERNKRTRWSAIEDKAGSVYAPVLRAFIDEVKRAYAHDRELPRKMVEYLIGVKDYYKIISHDEKRLTLIRTFNMHGTLNKPDSRGRVSEIRVQRVVLPTELIDARFKSGSNSMVEMYLDNGWTLSFRIHSASTLVEPSLKFDIQFVGMPVSVLTIECKWK